MNQLSDMVERQLFHHRVAGVPALAFPILLVGASCLATGEFEVLISM